MKKFLLLVVLLAIVGGVGYGAWWYTHQPGDEPSDAVAEPVAEQPTEPVEDAPPPAPAGPLQLTAVECQLTTEAGWAVDEAAQEGSVVPGGQAVVLRKGAAGQPPFLVVGRIPAESLGGRDPERYPNTFVAELRSRLGKLQPPPKITATGAPKTMPALFASAMELLAEGAFDKLGLPSGSARFVAGVTADKQVYLALAFTAAGSPDETEVDAMIASLAPLPQAEAAPASGDAAAPAEAGPESPAATESEAAPAESPTSSGAAAPAEAAPESSSAEPATADETKPAAAAPKPAAPAGEQPAEKPAATPKPAAPAGEKPAEDL